MPGRLAQWNELLGLVAARSAIPGGVRLELIPSAPLAFVVALISAESACCSFFAFSLTIDARGIGLEVRAPESAADVLEALVGAHPAVR